MEHTYDVVVVGGGAVGEVAAGRVADGGLSTALVERELVGGQCSYWACMPAKALLRPGNLLAEAGRLPGVAEAVTGDLDVAAVLRFRDRMAHAWDDSGQVEWLEEHGVDLFRGHGRFAGPRRVAVGDQTLIAREAVVIATGSRAAIPPIDGIDEVEVWDNRDATSADRAPRRMLVVGGGAVGVEMSQAWHRLGTQEVVVVEEEPRLIPGEEPFASEEIAAAFGEAGIDVRTGCRLEAVEPQRGAIRAHLSEGGTIDTDVILSAVGRTPATDDLGLETIGLDPGAPIAVGDDLRSEHHPGWLFAVGDVNGEHLLTHMGKYEARIAGDVILGEGGGSSAGRSAAPRVLYTDPAVAAAGLTEAAARDAGIEVVTRRSAIGARAQASLWGEETGGTAQVVIEASSGLLIGATFTGPGPVAELLFSAQVAIAGRVPVSALRHAVPSFPTFSEVWLDLAEPQ